MSDKLKIRYLPLQELRSWDKNPKRHDIDLLIKSFSRYGFKDPPKWEPSLNDGRGGIVEGNGRYEALETMRQSGATPPRGVVEKDGEWIVPVLFGVDSSSISEAAEYALDHNAITIIGGGKMTAADAWLTLFDEDLLPSIEDLDIAPITAEALALPVDDDPPETFPSFDDDIETEHRCPKCGYEWSGSSRK